MILAISSVFVNLKVKEFLLTKDLNLLSVVLAVARGQSGFFQDFSVSRFLWCKNIVRTTWFYPWWLQLLYPVVSFFQGNNFTFSSNLQPFCSSKPCASLWDDQERCPSHVLNLLNLLLSPKGHFSAYSCPSGRWRESTHACENVCAGSDWRSPRPGLGSDNSQGSCPKPGKTLQRYFCLLSPPTQPPATWDFLSMT